MHHDSHAALTLKGQYSGTHFVENYSQCINITARIRFLPFHLFRGNIEGGNIIVVSGEMCNTKIGEHWFASG